MKVASAWSGHDCSFCILDNGQPVVHAEYERYIREKEPYGDGVQFMFDEMGDLSDIKAFVTNHSFNKRSVSGVVKKDFDIVQSNGGKICAMSHHQTHAANAFFSNFDDALIFTMDGGGMETIQVHNRIYCLAGERNKITPISCSYSRS